MTRLIGESYTDTIAVPPATTVVEKLLSLLEIQFSGYQEGGTSPWITDVISATDLVLISRGDPNMRDASGNSIAGDGGIFIRLQSPDASTLNVSVFSDYTTASSTGRRESTTTSTSMRALIDDTVEMEFWLWHNSYAVGCLFRQTGGASGDWHGFIAGQALRSHIPGSRSGIGRLSSDVLVGAGTLALDRDLRGAIQNGQKIWVINQTPSGDALLADNVQVFTVNGPVTDTAIPITPNVAVTQFDAFALVGLDPQNVFATGADATGLGDRAHGCHRADGAYIVNANRVSLKSLGNDVGNAIGEFGFAQLCRIYLTTLDGPAALRGTLEHMVGLRDTGATLTPEDLLFPNDNASNGFLIQNIGPQLDANNWWAVRKGTA